MGKGRVLIIEGDEWETVLLAKLLGDAGYDVTSVGQARAGFEQARTLLPACIVCDVDLPDVDGYWVARRVRTEPSAVATTPFLFLTTADDSESRLLGLNVGADVYMTKPYRNEELVAQVGALIKMAERLRRKRDSFIEGPQSGSESPAFRGDLAFMSVATMLTLLEMERTAGVLKVQNDDKSTAILEIAYGAIASFKLNDRPKSVLDGLREVLRWKHGRFAFRAKPIAVSVANRPRINQLLLEAMRLEDEAGR